MSEYDWLSETESAIARKENLTPKSDAQLVKLFKSVNDQGTMVTDDKIIEYIQAVIISL